MLTEALRLPAGATIAINAANSAIGLMLLKMAARLQLRTVAIVRSPQAAKMLDAASPDKVMINQPGAFQAIRASGGVDAALDCIGGSAALALAEALNPAGQFISYGLLSGKPVPPALWQQRPDIAFSYFHLRQWVHQASRQQIDDKLQQVFALIRDGIADTHIAAIFLLREISAALRYSQQQRPAGKILLHC